MKLLLADDSETIRAHFSEVLSERGFDVQEVESGESALKALESDSTIDVVLLDCNMPGVQGPEVCRRVRSLPRSRYTYIILFTATGHSEDVVAGLAAGADDFVLKSVSETELVARLRNGVRIIDLQNKLLSESHRRAQAQRMESVGHLSTGLAHQLNTPTQYVIHNLEFVKEELSSILSGLAALAKNGATSADNLNLDHEFLSQEIPQALEQSIEGLHQIRNIVAALKEFSQPPSLQTTKVNLNTVVRNVLSILGEAGTAGTTIEAILDPALPDVEGFADDFNQAVLQLIVHARDALQERPRANTTGLVSITTSVEAGVVRLAVGDNGAPLSVDQLEGIFDSFVDQDSTDGNPASNLYFVHVALTQRHAGMVKALSEVSKGTEIVVELPITLPPQTRTR